jgi:membrane associated rhomboid family serine protease
MAAVTAYIYCIGAKQLVTLLCAMQSSLAPVMGCNGLLWGCLAAYLVVGFGGGSKMLS